MPLQNFINPLIFSTFERTLDNVEFMNRLKTLYYPQPIYEKVINRTKCPIDKIVTIHITILMGHTKLVSCENL